MNANENYKLIPYLYDGIIYAIPTNSSPSFKMHIIASLIAYKEDNLSFENMDEILQNLNIEDFTNEDTLQYDISQDQIIEIIRLIEPSLDILNEKFKTVDITHYCLAMKRLHSTFESCLILLRNGYYIESVPLIRLIFEQLAWSYSIIGKDSEKILSSSVTKSISSLNDLIDGVSRIYGEYSQEAHIDVKQMHQYLFFDEGAQAVGYKLRSGKECKKKFDDLVLLTTLYILSIEKVLDQMHILDCKLNKDSLHLPIPNSLGYITAREQIDTLKIILKIIKDNFKDGIATDPFQNKKIRLSYLNSKLI